MSYLCERCGEEFNDMTEYKNHKVDHVMGRVEDKSLDEISGIPEPEPQEEKPIVAEPLEDPKPVNKKAQWSKPEPIQLTYRYTGNCPDCKSEVETLTIDDVIPLGDKVNKSKVVVVSWCPECRKKISQRVVSKL